MDGAAQSRNRARRASALARTVPPEDDHQATLRRLDNLARLLDSAYRIPGLGVRFGADALIGLLPGIGDIASAALSGYLVYEARRLGAPRSTIAAMIGNIALDAAIGAVPLVGDVADVFWRANVRNMALLRRHLHKVSAT